MRPPSAPRGCGAGVHTVLVNGLIHRRVRAAVTATAAALVLTACSGGGEAATPDPSGTESASASPSEAAAPSESAAAEPYLPVPEGVELTSQGSLLEVGDKATVAYEPRQEKVGVLDLKVTGLEQTTFEKSFQGWKLDARTKTSTPYFVDVAVTNLGRLDLGGRAVPLYLLDDENTLVEASTFAGDFKPCPSVSLPKKFAKGDRTSVCLVYLAPQGRTMAGVSFRPSQDFNAITWTGDVKGAPKPGEAKGGTGGKGGSAGKDDGGRKAQQGGTG